MDKNLTSDDKEVILMEQAEQSADYFIKKYRPQMEALQNDSMLKSIRPISIFDIWSCGKMLKQFEDYAEYMQEQGNASDLGVLPRIALDIITAAYGSSILPLIASSQPIDEERGTVYFKVLRAVDSRGNVTADESFKDPRSVPDVYPEGYAGEVVTESEGNTAGGTTNYTGDLATTPVRPNSVTFTFALATAIVGTDDGNGNIIGVGITGTVDYTTGAYDVTLTTNPAGVFAITVQYGTNFEESGDIPQMNLVTESTSIDAEIFLLGQETGIFKAYSMKRRFGMVAEDDMAEDLTNCLTAEIGNTAIARIIAALTASGITWDQTPESGVPWVQHKLELGDKLAEMERDILDKAGRGIVNVIIAGSTASYLISTLPGFTKQNVGATGPQVYGTINGMTVIRAPQVATRKIYSLYRGTGFFDAPMVYSTYMPLFVTTNQVSANNILKKAGYAATWAGLEAVVPNFISDMTITQS